MHKKIFLAATKQNDGKTLMAIGLISAFMDKFPGKIGFIKPVGQRYVEVDGKKIDEDSYLVHTIWDMGIDIKHLSPIAVERGFTERYITSDSNPGKLIEKIRTSYDMVAQGKEVVVVEGTGHAGVGSVFDLCNARVAKLLGAKVILVALGGVGRAIDEIALNKALFEKEGVELAGVVLNKVIVEKCEKIRNITRQGLERLGVELLGTIPYRRVLSSPTVREILEEIDGQLLCGEKSLHKKAERIIIGAMTPHQAIRYFSRRPLVIMPGDREDLIFAAVHQAKLTRKSPPVGLILTGKILPRKSTLRVMCEAQIPIIHIPEDTYTVASKIYQIIVKIHPSEKEKIKISTQLVAKNVNIERILEKIS